MTLAHWDEPDAPWDRLQLGDTVMPGVWEITGGECARQVDHKKTKDKDGARIHDLGLIPPRMSARGRMVSTKDWAKLQEILPDIHPRKKGGIKFPLMIFHPAVALLGVTQIYVERIRPPEIKDGVLEIQIDMIDFGDPKDTKVSKKPAAFGGYIGTDEDNAILAAQNRNWGLRRGGFGGNGNFTDSAETQSFPLAGGSTKFDHATDADFAKLTGEDTRHPPEETVVGSINPL